MPYFFLNVVSHSRSETWKRVSQGLLPWCGYCRIDFPKLQGLRRHGRFGRYSRDMKFLFWQIPRVNLFWGSKVYVEPFFMLYMSLHLVWKSKKFDFNSTHVRSGCNAIAAKDRGVAGSLGTISTRNMNNCRKWGTNTQVARGLRSEPCVCWCHHRACAGAFCAQSEFRIGLNLDLHTGIVRRASSHSCCWLWDYWMSHSLLCSTNKFVRDCREAWHCWHRYEFWSINGSGYSHVHSWFVEKEKFLKVEAPPAGSSFIAWLLVTQCVAFL